MIGVQHMYVRRMYRICTQSIQALLVVLVVSGFLAPRMSAVLAELIPGVQTFVICTGDSLVTITIGPDGEPIEHSETTPHPCVLADTIVQAQMTLPLWFALGFGFAHSFAVRENTQVADHHLALIFPTRGPPVPV